MKLRDYYRKFIFSFKPGDDYDLFFYYKGKVYSIECDIGGCIKGSIPCVVIIDKNKNNYYGIINSSILINLNEDVIPVDMAFDCESTKIKIVYRTEDNAIIWKEGKWLI